MSRTVGQKLSAILAYFVQIECACKNDFAGMGSWCRGYCVIFVLWRMRNNVL